MTGLRVEDMVKSSLKEVFEVEASPWLDHVCKIDAIIHDLKICIQVKWINGVRKTTPRMDLLAQSWKYGPKTVGYQPMMVYAFGFQGNRIPVQDLIKAINKAEMEYVWDEDLGKKLLLPVARYHMNT